MNSQELLDGLFRRESAHLVAALTRLLGPGHLAQAEDVVQEALASAVQAWRFEVPDDPKAWLLRVAKNRAIDLLRRTRRTPSEWIEEAIEQALSPEADDENQLAMMFTICDGRLSPETHVTLILRVLCGLSAAEIARAFLVDTPTIDRRLHRGRAHLRELGSLEIPEDLPSRQPSVEHALYLLCNEGYHGSDPEAPLAPALCADALRLAEVLASAQGTDQPPAHALAALVCFNSARLPARLDGDGVLLPLAEQDRSRWDRALIERGIVHLGDSARGERLTRWHLEAGIAYEHSSAASIATTNWSSIVGFYDALATLAPSPIIALNRSLAVAELHGIEAGCAALAALDEDARLTSYPFYWAARADLERRAGRPNAGVFYARAIALARSRAERASYERRLRAASGA